MIDQKCTKTGALTGFLARWEDWALKCEESEDTIVLPF